MTDFNTAREFAQFIKGLGFRVFVAKNDSSRGYGFITDAEGSRILSFGMSGDLGGNYGPPSRESGTGWRMDETIWSLKTADNVKRALYSMPPSFCQRATSTRGGWRHMTTLDQYLAFYGPSSQYQEV